MAEGIADVLGMEDELKYLEEGKPDKEDKTEKEESADEEDDVNDSPETEEDDDKEDSEEESEDEEESEEESDDSEDDEEEDLEAFDSIYQKLKSYDAKLLKKVPELRSVIFREQEYSKYYPTVEDAKQAFETGEAFAVYEKDLMAGKSEGIIKTLGQTNKKALETFVANFTTTLQAENKDLYFGMIYPEIKKALRAAAKSSDPRLKVSAENLNWFMFGDTDLAKDEGLKPRDNSKEDEIDKKEREFETRKSEEFTKEVANSIEKRTKSLIGKQFENSGIAKPLINSMVNDIYKRIGQTLEKDRTHMNKMNALWNKAARDGFQFYLKDSIKFAFLSRASVEISKARKAVLSEYKLDDKFKMKDETKKEVKRIPSSNMAPGKSNGKVDFKKIDWSKTTDADVLAGKITYTK